VSKSLSILSFALQAHPNSIALFVPAEITTYCFYPGKVKDYLVANAIFRMGGAGVLMTNKPALIKQSKYQLTHSVRIHTGQDDAAYRCAGTLQCYAAAASRSSRK
jgi:3-ketoacyl-CoA synthase